MDDKVKQMLRAVRRKEFSLPICTKIPLARLALAVYD
jgi:hypothetical protein